MKNNHSKSKKTQSPIARNAWFIIAFTAIGFVLSIAIAIVPMNFRHNFCDGQVYSNPTRIEKYGLPIGYYKENIQCEHTFTCQAIGCPPSNTVQSVIAIESSISAFISDIIIWTIVSAVLFFSVTRMRRTA